MSTLVLIDGTNYAFRAFYALPPMTTTSGFPTNALYGFTSMLLNLLKKERPDYLAIAFDARGPTFRKQKYSAYKAQRKPVPPELIRQLPYFRKVAEALRVPYFELSGYEADDIIATLVKRTEKQVLDVRILTSDKDLMQLVSSRVLGVDTLRNNVFDPRKVEEKWGVPPARLRDLLALQGDSSDNIPGVPGIGPKKARDLLREFDSVPNLLEQLDKVRNVKLRETLVVHQEAAKMSYELVTLETDVPLDTPFSSLAVSEPDLELCKALFEELEFRKFMDAVGAKVQATRQLEVSQVREANELEALKPAGGPTQAVAIRTLVDQGNPNKCTGIVLAASRSKTLLVPLKETAPESVLNALRLVLEDPQIPKVGHDIKADFGRLARRGFSLRGIVGDVGVASYLLNPSRSSYAFWELVRALLNRDPPDIAEDLREHQAPALILELHEMLLEELKQADMLALYRDMEVPLIPLLAEMEIQGIQIDLERLNGLSIQFEKQLTESEAKIFELAGETFNPNSPKQLQHILFEKLKLKEVKRTKTGPSTDQSVLEVLADKHPLPEEILTYRSIAKLKNTYVDALPKLVNTETSRIHTTLNQTATATGRLSSSEPNLQNIPIRGDEGRRIREAFVAPPGHVLLSADYSQIELRLLAHLSGDKALNAAFLQGFDIHSATAAEIFGVALPLVSQQMRRAAKAINFGILYGMGAFRLSRDLKIPRKEAEQYIKRYFERYSGVQAFLDETLKQARADGYVTTFKHRRRFLPELSSSNHNLRKAAERMVYNTPIQGSAADIIKLAMIRVGQALEKAGLKARMLLQVHDELIFEVPEEEVSETSSLIKSSMESVAELSCPLVVDIGQGSNWAEAH